MDCEIPTYGNTTERRTRLLVGFVYTGSTSQASMTATASAFVPIAQLSADSTTLDICRACLDLHSFHQHKRFFGSESNWRKLYKCIVQFSVDRPYGHGHLAAAYLHYRLRTLYRLCGEGAPHPEERPDQSGEKKRVASKRRRQQLRESAGEATRRQDDTAVAVSAATSLAATRSRSPLGTSPTLPRYHDAHPETQSLESLFSVYAQRCSLLHGVDFDMSNLPEKRSRKPSSSLGVASLPEPDRSIPAAVAPGYAECTRKAFDKVCQWLCETAPSELRMGADSVFLDVGSGYGKCVVQARLRAAVRKSIGIEYVAVRYLMGVRMLTECIPAQFQSVHARLGDAVELLQGDATDEQFEAQYEVATHIFMFDWVFNAMGKEGVLRLIDRSSDLGVLVCCQRLDGPFHKLHQMQASTGKQHPTLYFYARLDPE